jgi:RNA polymerase II-associated factor 1
MLGKSAKSSANATFLRRTEYISQSTRIYGGKSADRHASGSVKSSNPQKRRLQDMNSREAIIKTIMKGFNIAYPEDASEGDNIGLAKATPEEIKAWRAPRHPKLPKLKLLESYPILPDLDSYTDSGAYVVAQYKANPGGDKDFYDIALETALLRVLDQDDERRAEDEARQIAAANDPSLPTPAPFSDYEYYLPESEEAARNVKRKFNVDDPDKDDVELYSNENKSTGERFFKYSKKRVYETTQAVMHPGAQSFGEVILGLFDPSEQLEDAEDMFGDTKRKRQKAAYYHPVASRMTIRPRRQLAGGATQQDPKEDLDACDILELTARDLNEKELADRADTRYSHGVPREPVDADADGEAEDDE